MNKLIISKIRNTTQFDSWNVNSYLRFTTTSFPFFFMTKTVSMSVLITLCYLLFWRAINCAISLISRYLCSKHINIDLILHSRLNINKLCARWSFALNLLGIIHDYKCSKVQLFPKLHNMQNPETSGEFLVNCITKASLRK